MDSRARSFAFLLLPALILLGCSDGRSPSAGPPGSAGELSGNGFVHYHPYPDTGQCYCAAAYDFTAHGKMVAAISPAVHAHYGERLCLERKYAWITSVSTGKRIRVLIVDKGGVADGDLTRPEQHIMDLSIESFQALDIDGRGRHAGRIYVKWELAPAPDVPASPW